MQDQHVAILKNTDVSDIDKLLMPDGLVVPVSHAELKEIEFSRLQVWCIKRAIYQIPTLELIGWLSTVIGDRFAIEIGSGKGSINTCLGIVGTDSYLQTNPDIQEYYKMLGQTPVFPPGHIQRIEAVEAVELYKPKVVVGAFITHKHTEGMAVGNMFGPEEEKIVDAVETYIHIGNKVTHREKPILELPHEEYQFPWLVSRAIRQELNCIWVWNKKEK